MAEFDFRLTGAAVDAYAKAINRSEFKALADSVVVAFNPMWSCSIW